MPALAIISCAVVLVGLQSAQSPPPSKYNSSAATAPSLIVSPDPIVLGVLAPGQPARAIATLQNPHPAAIAVLRIETSCPCLQASATPGRIGPMQSARLAVAFDPSVETEFRGELFIKVIGQGEDRRILFRTEVRLDIRSGTTKEAFGDYYE